MWVLVMASSVAPVLLPVNQFDHFYRGGDRIGALRRGPGASETVTSTSKSASEMPESR